MTTLTPAAAAALPGDDWLRARRIAAAEQFTETPLPSTEEEVWRYSRIGNLAIDRFHLASANGPLAQSPLEIPPSCAVLITHNGRLVTSTLAANLAGNVQDALGSLPDQPEDAFSAANDAFCADPVVLTIPRGHDPALPVVVVHYVDEPGVAVFPRLIVNVSDGAEVTVAEVLLSTDVEALIVPLTELRVGRDARIGYLNLQNLGPRVVQLATQSASIGTQATATLSNAAFGGDYARVRTDCKLVGRGGTGNLVSMYFGAGHQMLDFRTFQDHQAPDCTSDLLFKGAGGDVSHAVYSGLIRVRPEGRGTNAFQTNRNLKLSKGAWAESVPNLEIENNDVHCSHASTVGPIDADQRFYIQSRGVPPEVADRLIVTGFFDEVIDRLAVPSFAGLARELVSSKLGAIEVTG